MKNNGMFIDPGLNLYIDTTTACNASCKFCIAPTAGRHNDKDGFLSGLDYALSFIRLHKGSVQIVGGEPMIAHTLFDTLFELRRNKGSYHRIVVNTNGTHITNNKMVAMKNAGVTHVNISRHHFDYRCNQKIMDLRPSLTNLQLREVIKELQHCGFMVRLNCNLISGEIDSGPLMDRYVSWAIDDMGVNTISFSQIFPLSLFDYQTPEYPGFTESAQVNLKGIVKYMDKTHGSIAVWDKIPWGKVSPWGGGSKWSMSADNTPEGKRRYWHFNHTALVSLKTLSGYNRDTGLPNKTTYNKSKDIELQPNSIYFLVLHPDGLVSASWDRTERVLFNPYPNMDGHFVREQELEMAQARGSNATSLYS